MTLRRKEDEAIKVVVRIRPLSAKEIQDGHKTSAVADEDRGTIEITNPSANEYETTKTFTFDAVFSDTSKQQNLYDICAAPVVQSVLEGYNGTIFAYGQVCTLMRHKQYSWSDLKLH